MARAFEKELDLFRPMAENSPVQGIVWQEFRPVNQYTPNSKVMFDISASPNLYYDLKRSTLRVKSKILKDDGSVPNSKTKDKDGNALTVDNVAPTNFLLHSLWSQLEIALQQKTITKIGDNHAHKAYIDALLSTSATQKNTGMMSQMFVKDTPGTLDDTTPNGSNEGLYDRYH
ncbi:MAG: hypothetical protein MJA29_02320, partial [Candidatus Omnitrophica bacterium]|nr:hypothetical protein [Candidatus Omnitrophota bacterium]